MNGKCNPFPQMPGTRPTATASTVTRFTDYSKLAPCKGLSDGRPGQSPSHNEQDIKLDNRIFQLK